MNAENLSPAFEVLLTHLLQWQYQSERRNRSWTLTIIGQRKKVNRCLKNSPSLKHKLTESVEEAYDDAIIAAEQETEISRTLFPSGCPWTVEQIINSEFYPD